MPIILAFFSRPAYVFTTAIAFRLILLFYGRWQDANSPFKYTDVDYLVFTDAARFIANGRSPYDRATYRYTPLLAWLLYPTTFGGLWFEFGKAMFAAGDVITGWLILLVLRSRGMPTERAMKFASIWLLNPMVANISTRGSSEGLLAVIVVALLWAIVQRRWTLAGVFLGFGVHFKIYPFIYATSIFWSLGSAKPGSEVGEQRNRNLLEWTYRFFNKGRIWLTLASFLSFSVLSCWMLLWYKSPFLEHTFLYHFTRIDHRHNFSIYNTLLHLNSAQEVTGSKIESLAFIPQLLLSVVLIPLCLAKKDLASTMLAQTFAFVTLNKVCTSQYFLWYMVFLPFYLPDSSLLRKPQLGVTALVLWVAGQAVWLQQGYELEFLGRSTFVPGLWLATVFFFSVNCWILGIVVRDIGSRASSKEATSSDERRKDR